MVFNRKNHLFCILSPIHMKWTGRILSNRYLSENSFVNDETWTEIGKLSIGLHFDVWWISGFIGRHDIKVDYIVECDIVENRWIKCNVAFHFNERLNTKTLHNVLSLSLCLFPFSWWQFSQVSFFHNFLDVFTLPFFCCSLFIVAFIVCASMPFLKYNCIHRLENTCQSKLSCGCANAEHVHTHTHT